MQLIDKDALLDGLINDDPKHALLYINHFPTVDPVKHEKWKRTQLTDMYTGRKISSVICTGCGHRQSASSAFCGGCGARMDGDVIDRSDT